MKVDKPSGPSTDSNHLQTEVVAGEIKVLVPIELSHQIKNELEKRKAHILLVDIAEEVRSFLGGNSSIGNLSAALSKYDELSK